MIGQSKAFDDGIPAFFPLPLNAALEIYREAGNEPPRYIDDPRGFHDSLKRQSAVARGSSADAEDDAGVWLTDLRVQAKQWATAFIGIRDAVGRLPTVPLWLWGAGVLLTATVRLRHLIVFRRRIAKSLPVSPSISRLVSEVSRDIGLRRTPRIVMTDARISPMIWCGRTTTLVLPRFLWRELDDTGRRAILYHELAHVRRRDHIITWIEWIVGAMYWWHPLVWWVRGRLREEAENCCDAWVTWLMPRGRRAYAEALLRTKQFADDSVPAKPAVGIGILTGRAKRFARRLTMVMTQKTTPTGSTRSIALVACVTLVGWLATPALSSDEKGKPCDKPTPAAKACGEVVVKTCSDACTKACDKTCATTCKHPSGEGCSEACVKTCSKACDKTCATTCKHEDAKECTKACVKTCTSVCSKADGAACRQVVVATPDGTALKAGQICIETTACAPRPPAGTTCVTAPRTASGIQCGTFPAVPAAPALLMALGDEDDDDDLAARMERLEHHMQELAGKLERLNGWQPVQPPRPIQPTPPIPPMTPDHGEAYRGAMQDYQLVLPDLAMMQVGNLPDVVRAYKVPAGRLEALAELMIRDDVPVRVRVVEGGIEVHGPEWVQANFKAFVDIITAGEEQQPVTYKLAKGKLDALQALMVRSDVPVIVTPGEREIAVHGDAATQAVFRNFVNMIEGKAAKKAGEAKSTWFGDASEWQAQVKSQQAKTKALAKEYKLKAEQAARIHARKSAEGGRSAHRDAIREIEQAIKELTRNTDRIEREIERLENEADRFEKKADEMRRKAEALRAKAERSRSGEEMDELHERADATSEQADEMTAQVEQIRDQVLNMEDQAESMEDEVDMLQERLAQLEEEAEGGDA